MKEPTTTPAVCPVERADAFDTRLRRWLQKPGRILDPHVTPGMRVLDYGCGPGFFILPLAHKVGPSGQVVAADLQPGMLARVQQRLDKFPFADRVRLHQCGSRETGLSGVFDFVLACYVVHELADQDQWFRELARLMKAGSTMLVMEPPLHVSRGAFRETLARAAAHGLRCVEQPRIFYSMTALLQKG